MDIMTDESGKGAGGSRVRDGGQGGEQVRWFRWLERLIMGPMLCCQSPDLSRSSLQSPQDTASLRRH
jgi:hypothetical protein